MAKSNRDRVSELLDALKAGLAPYIVTEYERVFKSTMLAEISDALTSGTHGGLAARTAEDAVSEMDVQACLNAMSRRWEQVFKATLGKSERGYVGILSDARNNWAHQKPFTNDQAYEAASIATRLLEAVGASKEAAICHDIATDLLRLRFEAEQKQSVKRSNTGNLGGAPTTTAPTPRPGSYTAAATSKTPALIIYLLDVSGSMGTPDIVMPEGNRISRIELVSKCLEDVAISMVARSTRGTSIQPRYRIALLAYSGQVWDVLGGIKTVDEFAQQGVPNLSPQNMTNTESAFLEAERILLAEIPNLPPNSPAPMVCHLTDGEYNGGDPGPVAQGIMNMSTPDGNVLVENIYIGPNPLGQTVTDPTSWTGLTSESEISNPFVQELFRMSSVLPTRYAGIFREFGYHNWRDEARMLFAGNDSKMIEMAFVMSGVTPTR
ncbi:MAG: ATPase AAA [Chloroflexi bacterium OLB13]|nr:MAG: ATPase AAA [Chloroflexi bacterium OLB13]